MTESTPNLLTPQQFNDLVRGWTITTRSKMAKSAPKFSGTESPFRSEQKLSTSLTYRIRKDPEGLTNRLKYQFPRHGVFVHYGVGRGYVRAGNTVVRSSRSRTPGMNRHPDDWFDVHIREGLPELAVIAQDFYGDWALNDMLSKIEKFTIERKQ